MGTTAQQLVVNEVAGAGTVAAAGLTHKASRGIYFIDITES